VVLKDLRMLGTVLLILNGGPRQLKCTSKLNAMQSVYQAA
jgi:hypothetical protein